jgi:2-isopropylmalate synthase
MENNFGYDLPKKMHPEFSAIVQRISDSSGVEIEPEEIWQAFSTNYLEIDKPYLFKGFSFSQSENDTVKCILRVHVNSQEKELSGEGNGPIDACAAALYSNGIGKFQILDFYEHALSSGADAEAACYIQISDSNGLTVWGVGKDSNTTKAGIKALLCALNRSCS